MSLSYGYQAKLLVKGDNVFLVGASLVAHSISDQNYVSLSPLILAGGSYDLSERFIIFVGFNNVFRVLWGEIFAESGVFPASQLCTFAHASGKLWRIKYPRTELDFLRSVGDSLD